MMYTQPHPWIGLCKLINFCLTLAPLGLAAALFGQFLYVATSSNDVLGYTINTTTGALTPISGSPFPTGEFPRNLTVDSTGRFAYVASFGANNVPGAKINSATGALTPIPGSPFLAEMGPGSVAVSPGARFAYVANFLSSSISGYKVDQTTGALTSIPGSPFTANFSAGSEPFFATVDPTGKFLYVTIIPCCSGSLPSGILGYTINSETGALNVIGFTPDTQCCPQSMVVDPTGKYVYATSNGTPGGVFAYAINPNTGALTSIPGSPFSAGNGASAVASDPTGKFVYVVSFGGLFGLMINTNNGALAPIAGSPFFSQSGLSDVVVDPTGRYVYAGSPGGGIGPNDILIYSIDAVTGALTSLPELPLAANNQPGAMAISPVSLLAVSVTPDSGSGASQIFAFQYSDSHGFNSLTNVWAGFGATAYGDAHTCRVEYLPGRSQLFLKNDAGTAFMGPVAPGVAGTLSNSQCTLNAGASSVTGSGDILTLNLAFSFKPAFAGMQGIFSYAIDKSGLTTPGRQQVGTWDVTP